jgi:hypothetical protein
MKSKMIDMEEENKEQNDRYGGGKRQFEMKEM